eukprot:351955-Chlamydomonas_euryale.AAC.14
MNLSHVQDLLTRHKLVVAAFLQEHYTPSGFWVYPLSAAIDMGAALLPTVLRRLYEASAVEQLCYKAAITEGGYSTARKRLVRCV